MEVIKDFVGEYEFLGDLEENVPAIWDDIKDTVMFYVLEAKFQDRELRKKLLDTGDAYIEDKNDMRENRIGKMLMQIRTQIRGQENRNMDDDGLISAILSAPVSYSFGHKTEEQDKQLRPKLIPHYFSENYPKELKEFFTSYREKLIKQKNPGYYLKNSEITFGYGEKLYRINEDSLNIDPAVIEANAIDLLNELYELGCNYGAYYGIGD